MIVLDVETTGTDPLKHSLVSIGAIDFNKPDRQFYEECRMWEGAHVMEEALSVNGMTREQISDPKKKTEGQIITEFLEWLNQSEEKTIAGQNPFFDVSFIYSGAARNGADAKIPRRIIDQHSICWYHMKRRGLTPPLKEGKTDLNSDVIMEYVGIPVEPKPHIALNGAKWEVEAFSRLIYDKSILSEFKQFPIPWLQ